MPLAQGAIVTKVLRKSWHEEQQATSKVNVDERAFLKQEASKQQPAQPQSLFDNDKVNQVYREGQNLMGNLFNKAKNFIGDAMQPDDPTQGPQMRKTDFDKLFN